MRRIRVAHVITRLCKGGAQENTFHTVRLAHRDRYEVDLISGPTQGAEGSIEDAVRDAGIDILRVPNLVREVRPAQDVRAYRNLLELFRARRYDIVHTHTSKAGYLGRLAAARARVPIIVHTPHGHIFFGYFNTILTAVFTLMERHAARHSDKLIALTPRGIREHLEQGVGRPEQWTSIFSGIDLHPFEDAVRRRDATRAKLEIPEDAIVIGGVGRLEPIKGFSYFIAAARIVAQRVPQAHFIVVGDGSMADELRRAGADLGSRLRFLGLRKDVPNLMAAMDVFVAPSVNEGMGRVLVEAAAAGVPSVASAVGGVPDIVRDGETGFLVPPKDANALAEAILRLTSDVSLRARIGAEARAHAQGFSLDRMVTEIETLYEKLIEEKQLDT
ncbi:MAG: glycosyltransferase family 4 protein [Candidatus Hydrogenedentes bacterium]|nr:glycosyltransferase family 4 protein [Candidatus Hydrogenedentota bacterium]